MTAAALVAYLCAAASLAAAVAAFVVWRLVADQLRRVGELEQRCEASAAECRMLDQHAASMRHQADKTLRTVLAMLDDPKVKAGLQRLRQLDSIDRAAGYDPKP